MRQANHAPRVDQTLKRRRSNHTQYMPPPFKGKPKLSPAYLSSTKPEPKNSLSKNSYPPASRYLSILFYITYDKSDNMFYIISICSDYY